MFHCRLIWKAITVGTVARQAQGAIILWEDILVARIDIAQDNWPAYYPPRW